MKKNLAFLVSFFITHSVFADMTCDTNISNYYAIYQLNSYVCSGGEFLPANTLGCRSCPNGYTCNGGTFYFDADNFQGLNFSSIPSTTANNVCANNFPNRLDAIYEPNEHICSNGYYMPMNTDGCVVCPENSYCSGGTYRFNETVNQGIASCPNNLYSPVGSSSIDQCGRILHVGDDVVYLKSTKQTTPSLNIKIGDDVFYANMTTTPTYMNKDSSHYLRIKWGDNGYYVCDDTVYQSE